MFKEPALPWYSTPPLIAQLCAMATPGAAPLKSVTTGILDKEIAVRRELSLKEVRDVFRALKMVASRKVKRTKKFEMRFGNARVRMMFGKELTVKAKPRKHRNK